MATTTETLFTKPKLILVEGKDDEDFLLWLLNRMGLMDSVQIKQLGGNTEEYIDKAIMGILINSGFKDIASYAIILDADRTANSTLDRINGCLSMFGQPAPKMAGQFTDSTPRVGVFLLSGPNQIGALEDLCLTTAQDHPALPCVVEYLKCLNSLPPNFLPKNPAKATLLALLAGQPGPVNTIGVAAQQGLWPFDHPALDPLKGFLADL